MYARIIKVWTKAMLTPFFMTAPRGILQRQFTFEKRMMNRGCESFDNTSLSVQRDNLDSGLRKKDRSELEIDRCDAPVTEYSI
jgi:hypothetical protein